MKQLANKPAKLARFTKFNEPKKRKFGADLKKCRKCGKTSVSQRFPGVAR